MGRSYRWRTNDHYRGFMRISLHRGVHDSGYGYNFVHRGHLRNIRRLAGILVQTQYRDQRFRQHTTGTRGILDRFDAIIFTIPAIFVYMEFMY